MLLPVTGDPMVRRTVRAALDAGLEPVIVVLGHEAQRVREALAGLPCAFTESDDFTGPTSASLHAGLRALDRWDPTRDAVPDDARWGVGAAARQGSTPTRPVDAAVVLLGDMVHVTADMIAALARSARTGRAPLEVSRYGDVLAPPLLFRRALWPELLAWTGEGCGKTVVRAHEAEATIHDWPVEALRDVDTPADYEALTR